MIYFPLVAAIAASCYAVYWLYCAIHDRRVSKQLQCQPAYVLKDQLFGLRGLLRIIDADKRGAVPDEYVKFFAESGRTTFQSSLFGTSATETIEPKNIQAILATKFRDFELGDLRRNTFFPLLGNGIFTEDGKQWEHSRAMLRPQFIREQVSDLGLEERHVQTLLRLLPADESGWTAEVDVLPMFFRLTIDSATEFLFGESVGAQDEAVTNLLHKGGIYDHKWVHLAKAFDEGTMHLGLRGRLFNLYWLHSPQSFKQNCKTVHAFADHYVQNVLEQLRMEKSSTTAVSEKPKYVFLRELAKVTQDPVELRSQMIHILLAGRDTTASLLSWTFWLLARHPDVFERLRREVVNQFGDFEDDGSITFNGLKSCTYLQHVLNEVLRLYPPVPLNSRRATRDTSLPLGGGPDGLSPVFIKKGQEVGYYVYATHRRKDLWGPDADDFRPDRWIGRKPGWEYLPFNGGPRICLGQQFALTEAGYVITRMVQKFDSISTSDTNRTPRHNYGVTDAPKDCIVRFHKSTSRNLV